MSYYIEGNEFPHVTKCTKEEFERDSEPLVVNNYILPEVEDKGKENNNPLPEWDNSTTYLGGEEVMLNGKRCAVSSEFDDLVSLGYVESINIHVKNKTSTLHSGCNLDRELELFTRANCPTTKEITKEIIEKIEGLFNELKTKI